MSYSLFGQVMGVRKFANGDIEKFNNDKQQIYCNSDIFLQLSNSEGNSYATLDALLCGLVVISSNVGLFYKDVPEDRIRRPAIKLCTQKPIAVMI